MSAADYSELTALAMAADQGQWETERPERNSGSWIHNGRRVHVADNVGTSNAAFIAAAYPEKIIGLVDDYAQERNHRLSAEQELIELRRESEILRHGVKGDFDLDAWLAWCVAQKKLMAGNVDPAFECEERVAFEAWYVRQHYAGEAHVVKIFPALFMRWERGAGAYVIEQVEREWIVWWGRALNLPRQECDSLKNA